MLMWKPTGHICPHLLVQQLQPLLLVEVRALYYSPPSFQPNPSLTIFSASSALPLQTKWTQRLLFFSKPFEPILRHVLRDKMTPLYIPCDLFHDMLIHKLLQNDTTCQQVIKTINMYSVVNLNVQ